MAHLVTKEAECGCCTYYSRKTMQAMTPASVAGSSVLESQAKKPGLNRNNQKSLRDFQAEKCSISDFLLKKLF